MQAGGFPCRLVDLDPDSIAVAVWFGLKEMQVRTSIQLSALNSSAQTPLALLDKDFRERLTDKLVA